MLDTCFGELTITVNGVKSNYTYKSLPCRGKCFWVSARYQVDLDLKQYKGQDLEVIYSFPPELSNYIDLIAGAETGQDLAALTLVMQKKKLTLGTIGDIPKVRYRYDNRELAVRIPAELKFLNLVCYVAWKVFENGIEDEDTWFAADPSLSH